MTEQLQGKDYKVLIVEDDDTLRLALGRYFEKRKYETILATDGLSAIKELIDSEIDVIISDYKMEVLGGDYWMRFLTKHYSDKTIIITSGFLKPDFTVPFPVIYKPFDFEELEAKIVEAVAQPHEKH